MLSPVLISSPELDDLLLPHPRDLNDSPSSKTRFSPSNRIPNASSEHIDSQPEQSPPSAELQVSSPQKRHRKSGSATFDEDPFSFNEIYDRIDRYFDQEKLFYISPTPLNSHKNVLTLKACPKLERNSLGSPLTQAEASTNPGSMNLDSLNSAGKGLAMPSFLKKRGSLQKTKSEKSVIHPSTRAKTFGVFTNNSETDKIEKSSFSKFNFLNIDKEGTEDC